MGMLRVKENAKSGEAAYFVYMPDDPFRAPLQRRENQPAERPGIRPSSFYVETFLDSVETLPRQHSSAHKLLAIRNQQRVAQLFRRLVDEQPKPTKMTSISWDDVLTFLREPQELEAEFREHAQKWEQETKYSSSLEEMVIHPSYQRIVGMGRQVVPLLLRELQQAPQHWFWALHAISGEDPAQGTTTLKDAVQAWLQWGRERRYIE